MCQSTISLCRGQLTHLHGHSISQGSEGGHRGVVVAAAVEVFLMHHVAGRGEKGERRRGGGGEG